MRHISHKLPILIVLLAAAACGGPQQPPPWMRPAEKPRDENYHGGNAAMLLKYDANHDGTVTRAELIAGLKADFAARDVEHKGCLGPDQAAQINQERVDADHSTATPVVDWDQDGCINYTEFSAVPYSLFDQLDADHDGKLTNKELQRAGAKKPDAKPDDANSDAPDGAGPPPGAPSGDGPGGGEHGQGRRGGGPPGGRPPGP